jgi:hypothetical protein
MANNHSRTILTLLVGLLILGFFIVQGQTPRPGTAIAARYQLYQADFDILPAGGKTYRGHTLFRIDIESGATSHIVAGTTSAGEYYEKWFPVDESPKNTR